MLRYKDLSPIACLTPSEHRVYHDAYLLHRKYRSDTSLPAIRKAFREYADYAVALIDLLIYEEERLPKHVTKSLKAERMLMSDCVALSLSSCIRVSKIKDPVPSEKLAIIFYQADQDSILLQRAANEVEYVWEFLPREYIRLSRRACREFSRCCSVIDTGNATHATAAAHLALAAHLIKESGTNPESRHLLRNVTSGLYLSQCAIKQLHEETPNVSPNAPTYSRQQIERRNWMVKRSVSEEELERIYSLASHRAFLNKRLAEKAIADAVDPFEEVVHP